MPPIAEAQKLAMEAQRYAATTLKNTQVIEAMGMMGSIRGRWLAIQRQFLAKQAEASDHAGSGAAISKFIQIAQSSLVLGFASWLTLIGALDPSGGVMIVAWTLSSRALAPLQQLIGQWKTVAGARDTYARLGKLLAAIPVQEKGMSLPPPKGALAVETLVAGAPGSSIPILRGVNFSLSPGQVLAVVGPSASGKSTLARLLVGLWPAAGGKVRLDGVDVYTWNKQELGPHIGYLPQDNELFDGSLAENIARFGDVDLGKVEAAARAVGLHEMIIALPDGYDTWIGAGGSVLSGGQRQRVALARAIYNDPQFIVLDEPNSSLDEAGEEALLQTLLQLKARGVTLVVITHRTNVLAAVDRMLILQEGQMQSFGPRDEVLTTLAAKAKSTPAAAPAPVLVAT
jgi:ATP-binding cassette subfamily C exporter for protease/lipase